jgi:hypothetical protein
VVVEVGEITVKVENSVEVVGEVTRDISVVVAVGEATVNVEV